MLFRSLSGSRSVFALAEHGDLPAVFGRVHPTYRTPYVAIWFTSLVLIALALSGSFVFLAAVSAVARLVIYLSTCLATLRLRRAEFAGRVGAATFTVPLGPIVPSVACVLTVTFLAGATAQQLLAGTGALVAGAVLYYAATRSR